jgi:hypothetical protein
MRFIAHYGALSLLRINIECKQLYISQFPIVLPLLKGKLRMRSVDILYMWNVVYLVYKLEFSMALSTADAKSRPILSLPNPS